MTNRITEITSQKQLDEHLTAQNIAVLNFWTEWAAPCKQMNAVFAELATKSSLSFVQINAEELSEISEAYEIVAVPAFVFVKDGKVIDRLNGATPAELTKLVLKYDKQTVFQSVEAVRAPTKAEDINARLKALISMSPVMLFMKGTPEAPKCGFSRQIVEILNDENIKFGYFDILTDEIVRQKLKEFSEWPTYPQLYANGELIGGLDIVKELKEAGELKSSLGSAQTESQTQSLNDRLKALINQKPVMLFMKGEPGRPQCGFSRQIVDILDELAVEYGHFDILSDEAVRQGLKEYSDWPTYPQLYVKGELIGGLDIVKELQETGELEETLRV